MAAARRPAARKNRGKDTAADHVTDPITAADPAALTDSTSATAPTADHPVAEIAAAWQRERPGTPVSSIGIVTPIWRLAKLLGDDRRRVLARAAVDAATLDLLSVLRRSGPPYTLSTRELSGRSLVTAGAISQRVTRAERDGLVTRRPGAGRPRTVLVHLTDAGHALVEATVDQVLTREADLLTGLSAEQQRQLTELLEVLLRDVQQRLGDDRITHVGHD